MSDIFWGIFSLVFVYVVTKIIEFSLRRKATKLSLRVSTNEWVKLFKGYLEVLKVEQQSLHNDKISNRPIFFFPEMTSQGEFFQFAHVFTSSELRSITRFLFSNSFARFACKAFDAELTGYFKKQIRLPVDIATVQNMVDAAVKALEQGIRRGEHTMKVLDELVVFNLDDSF